MSAPETVSVEQLFAAAENDIAVRRIRFYLEQLDLSIQRCAECPGGVCSLCVERGRIVADIRAFLPKEPS